MPDLFDVGTTVNLPASNEPLGDIIRPVCLNFQQKLSVLQEFAGLKPSSPLMMSSGACHQKSPKLTEKSRFGVVRVAFPPSSPPSLRLHAIIGMHSIMPVRGFAG